MSNRLDRFDLQYLIGEKVTIEEVNLDRDGDLYSIVLSSEPIGRIEITPGA